MTIALLCLAQPASVEVGPPNWIARHAELRVGGATISVHLSGDNLRQWIPAGASVACEGNACLSYRKYCGQHEAQWLCRYETANNFLGAWLTIRAPDEAALRAAEGGLGVRVRLDDEAGTETAIPLAKFDVAQPLPDYLRYVPTVP